MEENSSSVFVMYPVLTDLQKVKFKTHSEKSVKHGPADTPWQKIKHTLPNPCQNCVLNIKGDVALIPVLPTCSWGQHLLQLKAFIWGISSPRNTKEGVFFLFLVHFVLILTPYLVSGKVNQSSGCVFFKVDEIFKLTSWKAGGCTTNPLSPGK